MPKLGLQYFAGFAGNVTIYSNDGSVVLYSNVDDMSSMSVTVTSTGATITSLYVNDTYTYNGDKTYLGLALTANATTPDYAVGTTIDDGTYYIVEGTAASTGGSVITGEAVPNATSYELYEKSGTSYTLKSTSTEIRFDLTSLNLSAGSHTFVVKAKADGYQDSDYSNEVISAREQLTKPVLTDLSTSGICKFSFPNDTRAYAYKIFVDGVEQGYPLKWTAALADGIYTVTMNDSAFPTDGTYSITAQAYVLDDSYYDSDVSEPITFTKAASGYMVSVASGYTYSYITDNNSSIKLTYSGGSTDTVACKSLSSGKSYQDVKELTLEGVESTNDLYYTMGGTSGILTDKLPSIALTADLTIDRVNTACLTGDTLITMADGTERRIDALKVGDAVLSYNPATRELESDEIIYSDAGANKTHNYYDVWEFSNGSILKTVHRHRLYNIESQGMVNMDEWQIGDHALTRDGCVALVKHTHVNEIVNHYTLFTKNQNYFANGLLAGNKYTPDMELGSLCE